MVVKYLLRLAVTAIVIYALMVYARVKIPALLIGISTVIISIFGLYGLLDNIQQRGVVLWNMVFYGLILSLVL